MKTTLRSIVRCPPNPEVSGSPKVWQITLVCCLVFTGQPASVSSAESKQAPEFSAADVEFFEREVRPLLVKHCYECHGGEEHEGGLRLTSRAAILRGGDTREAIIAGNPDESLLVDAIKYGDLYQMPPKSKLPASEIQTIVEWVQRGAPWPAGEDAEHAPDPAELFDLEARKASHWSWQPVKTPTAPAVKHPAWPSDPLDNFILARLESAELLPAPPAEPNHLVRRAYFDLIGLPPPPEKVEAFTTDPSPQAFAKLVDELLASPQFGERWARHWLDLVRYAESRGHEFDYDLPNAWQYRDYLIRAFNGDVPYDQFVTEHIAGDLIEPPRTHPTEGFNESVLATGFWYLGEWVHSPVDIRKDETDRMDNAIDVYSKAFLGLTVSCARCHDHKFDAISQKDYYALGGFLQSSTYQQVRFESVDHNRKIAKQLTELREKFSHQLSAEVAAQVKPATDQLVPLLRAATELLAGRESGQQIDDLSVVAKRYGVETGRLSAWLEQLDQARADANHPLHLLALSSTSGFAAAEKELNSIQTGARKELSNDYQILVDYRDADTPWLTDGPAYGPGPLVAGTVLPGTSAAEPIAEVIAVGQARLDHDLANLELKPGTQTPPWAKEKWNPRPGTILRTPNVTLAAGKLYYLMSGGAYVQAVVDSHRAINGPLHRTTQLSVKNDPQIRWVEHDFTRYVGNGLHVEFTPHKDDKKQLSPLSVVMVVAGNSPPPPPEELFATNAASLLGSVNSESELLEQLCQLIDQASGHLADASDSPVPALAALENWVADHPQLWANSSTAELEILLTDYHSQRRELLGQLRRVSATAPSMCDVIGEDEKLLVRGNSALPGEAVPRRLLTAIAGAHQRPIEAGSGRLELAKRTLAQDNPFTSRVLVNRVWHHLMGRGIVPSVDNFGVLGQEPTHPELLDYLATEFVADEWSVKRLIRRLMLSRTYQMASKLQPQSLAKDPQNLLYHRMPMRRLEGEVIRDAMLSVGGNLDAKQFGPSVPLYLTTFLEGRGRPTKSGPLDGAGRRSIYQAVRRNFPAPMMIAFDAPQPSSPRGNRTISNVPAQALMLMNDELVAKQAALLAERLIQEETDAKHRVERLYMETLARRPRAEETTVALEFLEEQVRTRQADSQTSNANVAAWADLCHVIFNTKEFIFLR